MQVLNLKARVSIVACQKIDFFFFFFYHGSMSLLDFSLPQGLESL